MLHHHAVVAPASKVETSLGRFSFANAVEIGNSRRRRRNVGIVAASPPRNDGVVGAGKTLTKQDLVAYLASGCKPKEKWRYCT